MANQLEHQQRIQLYQARGPFCIADQVVDEGILVGVEELCYFSDGLVEEQKPERWPRAARQTRKLNEMKIYRLWDQYLFEFRLKEVYI